MIRIPYEEPAPGSPLDIGQEIGRKAHLLFPGGVEVTEEPASTPRPLPARRRLGIRTRVDVLERLPTGAGGLREVKSSSGLKDHYIDDISLQTYVLRSAGIDLPSIELLHVKTAYVRGDREVLWPAFFGRLDVGMPWPGHLPVMQACVGAMTLPEAKPGSQCGSPSPWSRFIVPGCGFAENPDGGWVVADGMVGFFWVVEEQRRRGFEPGSIGINPVNGLSNLEYVWRPAT